MSGLRLSVVARVVPLIGLALLAACSDSTGTEPAPAALVVTTQPGNAVSGAPFGVQPVVSLRDAAGTVVLGGSYAVEVSVGSGGGTLVGTTTVNTVNGIATFADVRLDMAGDHILTFSTVSPLLTAASEPFTVAPGAPSQLAITTQAAGAASGLPFATQPVIEVRDAAGNRATGSTAVVTVTASAGTDLIGTTTIAAIAGVATFANVGLAGSVGNYTLSFAAPGLTGATQDITLGAGAPSQLVITTAAAGAASGAVFTTQPVVEVSDSAGNRVTDSSTAVTMTAGAGATVVGTATVNASAGVASFSTVGLSGGEGSHTLTFEASGLTSATQPIALGPGEPAELVVATQPGDAVSGAPFGTQPVIEIRDAHGNLTTSAAMVTAAIASGGGTLLGTAAVRAEAGVARFTNLRIDLAGTHALGFTTEAGITVTSAEFAVAPVIPHDMIITNGDDQTVGIGAVGVQPLRAKVTNEEGTGIPGVSVTWLASSGQVVNADSLTDSIGEAQAYWTVGEVVGPHSVEARVTEHPEIGRSFKVWAVAWEQVEVTGSSPEARHGPRLAYDPGRGVVVMHGGNTNDSRSWEEHWEFEGSAWTQKVDVGSPNRLFPGTAFDVVRNRLVLFGGALGEAPYQADDTWEFDGAAWALTSTDSNPGRREHPLLAYDNSRGQVVLYGGYGVGCDPEGEIAVPCEDTWEYDGVDWTPIVSMPYPQLYWGSQMVYDAANQRVLLVGRSLRGTQFETWTFDGSRWTDITPEANVTPPREFFSMMYDSGRGRVVLFGGFGDQDGSVDFADTWEFDGVSWHFVPTSNAPTRRSDAGFVFVPNDHSGVLFGGLRIAAGSAVSTFRDDTWRYRTR